MMGERNTMRYRNLLAVIAALLITGCFATYPQKPEDQATYHVDVASTEFEKGNHTAAGAHFESALDRPTGAAKVKEYFSSNPEAKALYLKRLKSNIQEISGTSTTNWAYDKIQAVKAAGIYSAAEIDSLLAQLNKTVADKNLSGDLDIDFDDLAKLATFPQLQSPEHQQAILDRTIKKLQNRNSYNRPIRELMSYVQKNGVDSPAGLKVASLLDTLNIRASELGVVGEAFSQYAAQRKEHMVARVHLVVKNADRLLADDIKTELRNNVRGVEWVAESGQKTITLVIERARNDEKILPDRTETITYSTSQVNIIEAALFMPRGASYLYDLSTGGAEIEYGYVINATLNDKAIHDEVVRGKVGGDYRRCQNARIQNVFGGVSPASFVANPDMQQRCSGSNSVSIDDLRKQVLAKLAQGVLNVAPIKMVHELNQ